MLTAEQIRQVRAQIRARGITLSPRLSQVFTSIERELERTGGTASVDQIRRLVPQDMDLVVELASAMRNTGGLSRHEENLVRHTYPDMYEELLGRLEPPMGGPFATMDPGMMPAPPPGYGFRPRMSGGGSGAAQWPLLVRERVGTSGMTPEEQRIFESVRGRGRSEMGSRAQGQQFFGMTEAERGAMGYGPGRGGFRRPMGYGQGWMDDESESEDEDEFEDMFGGRMPPPRGGRRGRGGYGGRFY